MFEIIKAGGWVMWPIILCSTAALAIIAERFWSLQRTRVIPPGLVEQVWQWGRAGVLDAKRIHALHRSSPLGRVLAAGLTNRHYEREIMKESIEEVGRHVAHDLGRYLNTLGTIAGISPLLGLLGTVFGMITMFSAVSAHGAGNPQELAAGIGQALITTAAGLTVAIPALFFHRYLRGKVDSLVVDMEQEAIKLVEVLHGQRAREQTPFAESEEVVVVQDPTAARVAVAAAERQRRRTGQRKEAQ
ncbi:MAG: MotA/TolQ/ExbB proton channel family protein [Chromatiales bacterium]